MHVMNLKIMETQFDRIGKIIGLLVYHRYFLQQKFHTVIPTETLPSALNSVCNRAQFFVCFPWKRYDKPTHRVLTVLFCTTVSIAVYVPNPLAIGRS
jgi:hypothetical protein